MPAREEFEYHDGYLHIRLLQPSLRRLLPDGIDRARAGEAATYDKTAKAIFDRIRDYPTRRERDLALRLRRTEQEVRKLAGTEPPGDANSSCSPYNPMLYSLWGPYDLAAIYFSRSLAPLPAAPDLEVRQTELCLFLPKLGADADNDCNADYLRPTDPISDHNSEKRHPDRFLSIVQVKLSPYSTWQQNNPTGATQSGPSPISAIGATVAEWRQSQSGRGRVALGLSLSWHEVVIVAHADDLHPLLDLILRIRRCKVNVDAQGSAHTALVTSSILGFDYAIESIAASVMQAAQDSDKMQLKDVQASARMVSDRFKRKSQKANRSRGRSNIPSITCSTHFCVNPGHEKPFLDFFDGDEAVGDTRFNVGGYDTSSPTFEIHPLGSKKAKERGLHLDAIAAAALTTMLRVRLFRSKSSDGSRGRQDFFASASSISTSTVAGHESVPSDHVNEDPRRYLFGREWTRIAPDGPKELRHLLRSLQVAYEDSEQVVNTVAVLRWTWDSMWLWEGTIELLPVVSSLVDYLKNLQTKLAALQKSFDPQLQIAIERRLRRLRQDIGETLSAVRTVLSAPHWSVTPVEARGDLNLRRSGSIEQIRSISTLVGWSMVRMLLGSPRATLATVGEPVSQASLQVGVVLLRVPIAVVEQPLFFEELATHVATMFLEVLNDGDYEAGKPASSPERQLEMLAIQYRELRQCADAGNSRTLVLGTNFLLASLLLGIDDKTLARSLFLQSLLRNDAWQLSHATQPRSESQAPPQGTSGAPKRARPTYDQETVLTLIARVLFGRFCRNLSNQAAPTQGDKDGRRMNEREAFERWVAIREDLHREGVALRELLQKECLIHPGGRGRVHELLEETRWREFVEEQIESCGWLRSPTVLDIAISFFRECHSYVASRQAAPRDNGTRSAPTDHWMVMRDKLARIREFLLDHTKSVTVTSSFLDESDRMRGPVIENDPRFSDYERLRLPPALTANHNESSVDSEEAVICQRGRLFFLSEKLNQEWAKHVASFYGTMISLQPLVRHAIGVTMVESRMPATNPITATPTDNESPQNAEQEVEAT